jgi:hypothetical protein
MRRWWLINLSMVVTFVALEVIGKSTFNQTALGVNKNNKPLWEVTEAWLGWKLYSPPT